MSIFGPLWTADEAAAATSGKNSRSWNAYGVSIDTRSLAQGDLFVALRGDNRDGHEFAADALKRGAAAALVDSAPVGAASDAALLMVRDSQAGLEGLGRAARARSAARIVAVTGSAGKTTTKEMLRLILAKQGAVAASAASYNNHWGVPLSLARMRSDAAYGVFELGMNHPGEIRQLVKQVRPHVALITTIAAVHLEYLGTIEAIADAKAEIFEGVEPGGTVILPADNPQFERLKSRARAAGVAHIVSFGTGMDTTARLESTRDQGEGQNVTAHFDGIKHSFFIGAPGRHIAMNAIAALLAARALGVDVAEAADALGGFSALKGRGARFAAGNIDIIDESYNANPASMAAALDLLGNAVPRAPGRRIAVLGDMLELGAESAALHRALGAIIDAANAGPVFLCGPHMESLWQALNPKRRGAYAEKSPDLVPALLASLRAGDVVLVKGSFGSRMSVIIDALKARADDAA